MKLERNPRGWYDVNGVPMISSTTVLKKLEKEALHPWIAKATAEQIRDFVLQPIIRGEMTPTQLGEMDLDLLMKEAKQAHERMKKDAADMGSLIHKVIEEYYAGKQDKDLLNVYTRNIPDLTAPILAFMKWEEDYKIKPIRAEHTVYSATNVYAGTLDLECIAEIPGVDAGPLHILVDFKSSSGVYDEHILQLASYVFAAEEMLGEDLEGGMIVRLDKITGIPEPHFYYRSDLIIPHKAFLSVKQYVDHERAWKEELKKARAEAKAIAKAKK
jgi:hypothetical protein